MRVAEEWKRGKIHPLLRGILEDAQDFALDLWQWPFVVTCILRTPAENDALYQNDGTHRDGVHVQGRGADIRIRDVDHNAVDSVVHYINNRFVYDPERPKMKCALKEGTGPGSSGPHMHIQAHPRTRMAYVTEED